MLTLKSTLDEKFCSIVVHASPDQLAVCGPAFILTKRTEHPVEDLENVYGFPSGVYLGKVNGLPERLELRVRDVIEAQWVATMLRRALRLPRPERAVHGDANLNDESTSTRPVE